MNDKLVKWVAALRSGKYKQARTQLGKEVGTDKARYCCLGVYCDLFYPNEMNVRRWKSCMPPQHIRAEINVLLDMLSNPNEFVDRSSGSAILATKNDKGANFNQIANFIERRANEILSID